MQICMLARAEPGPEDSRNTHEICGVAGEKRVEQTWDRSGRVAASSAAVAASAVVAASAAAATSSASAAAATPTLVSCQRRMIT
jgi:hypothetical protein